MADEISFEDYGPEYFTKLVTEIADHPDWEYRESNYRSINEVGETASEFHSEAEFVLDHTETDGELWLHAPNLTTPLSAVGGVLEQPLSEDERREPRPDTFGERFSQAYQSIAEDNEAEYVVAESDTSQVLGLQVPFDYDSSALNESLDAASNASRQVQEMNDEIVQVIESRI